VADKSHKIASSLAKIFSGNILLTLLNLVRDLSIAAFFGATLLSDYYFLAIMFPVFFNTVLAGAYRSTIIPFLEERKARYENGFPYLMATLNGSLIKASGLFGIVFVAVTWAVLYLAGRSDLKVEGVSVLYLFFAVIPIYALGAYLECNVGHMQFFRKFFLGSVLRLGLPIGTIVGCVLLAEKFSIYALPIGGLLGVLIVFISLSLRHYREKNLPAFSRRLEPSATNHIVHSIAALAIGTSMAYINPIVDQLVAATLGEGSIALLGYSNRLATGLSSLTAGAIGPVLLVYYSTIVVSGNKTELQDLFNRAFILCCWISCALIVVVISYAVDIVDLLYTRGNMSSDDSVEVGRLIQYYSCQYLPLIASAAVYPLISALNLNKVFVPINLTLCVVNLIADILLSRYFGLAGIAISTVVVYAISLGLMLMYLCYKGHIELQKKTSWGALSALLSAIIIYFVTTSIKKSIDFSILGMNVLQCVVIAVYCLYVLYICKRTYKTFKPSINE
jgi:putative peptidoglycan lipid II flippase